MKTLEPRKHAFAKVLASKRISATAKEFLYKLYVGVLDAGHDNLEYSVKTDGELYTFCYKVGEQKYEFYTDDYSEFRQVKRIADQVVLSGDFDGKS